MKKIDKLHAILIGSHIDIITISETWLHSQIDPQMVEIQGYKSFRLDRDVNNCKLTKKRGGGLITFVRNATMDVYVQKEANVSKKDFEIQWLKIKKQNYKTILLANVYRPPAGKVNHAIKVIETGLISLRETNDEVVILGEFNIDYKNALDDNVLLPQA